MKKRAAALQIDIDALDAFVASGKVRRSADDDDDDFISLCTSQCVDIMTEGFNFDDEILEKYNSNCEMFCLFCQNLHDEGPFQCIVDIVP